MQGVLVCTVFENLGDIFVVEFVSWEGHIPLPFRISAYEYGGKIH